MEDDRELSEDKTHDNKSILSLNFIYKKITIKEGVKNTKDNLKELNYEKIAKYKMKNMSLNFLLNSIFKLKKSLLKSNPLMKYIKNVKPYDYTKYINNIPEQNEILTKYIKYSKNNKLLLNNKKRKENRLDLSAKEANYKNYYYSRMINNDQKKVIHSRKEKIILIQKHIRGFLQKKIIDEEVNKIIIKKFIDEIIIIQRSVKQFLSKKKSLNNLIVNIIQNERKIKSNKITDLFSLYHYRNLYKKNLIIQTLLKQRQESILKIQKNYRRYIFIKKVKEIILKEKDVYILTYPFNAESVQIKIYYNNNKGFKIFDYFKCPIRKYFIAYINKKDFNSGEYLCHVIVNGNIILDKRYKYIVDKDNILYNLIYIGEKKPLIEVAKFNNVIVNNSINKSENNKKKKKKKKKIIEEEENSDDFYYYCYNENSNSTNSYSTKSFNDTNDKKNLNKNKRYKVSIDSQSTKKENENSIQSQKLKYNNILFELCQSVSSSKSNFSLNKINSYKRKTHKTKFSSKKRK